MCYEPTQDIFQLISRFFKVLSDMFNGGEQ